MLRCRIFSALLLLALPGLPLQAVKLKPLPSSALAPALDKALAPFIDSGKLPCLVVGVSLDGREEIRAYGQARPGSVPDADTVFEVASVTKTFTGLLLAQLVTEGKVALGDPLQKYLPPGVKVPAYEGRAITLLDLATHTSSLPTPGPGDDLYPAWYSPSGLKFILLHLAHWDFADPLLGVKEGDIYDALQRVHLKRVPGSQWQYSNLGMGLLGLALARAAGAQSYDDLLRQRIAAPLGLASTWTELPGALEAKVAEGHHEGGSPAPRMHLGPLAAAGGLKSSARDLMKYLAFQMGQDKAVLFSHQVQRRLSEGAKTRLLPLAWHDDSELGMLYHSGSATGFHSWVGFFEGRRAGLVLLSNSAAQVVEEIGPELLKQVAGLKADVPRPLVAVKLEPEALERYVGSYRLDKQWLTLSRDGDHLKVLWDGKKPTDLWPAGEDRFFCKEWDCRVTFKGGGADVKMYYNTYWAAKQP